MKTEERGWIGHCCVGDRCRFRRNTLLTHGDVRVVVSTVGALAVSDGKIEEVGVGRHFETMAFMAAYDSPYWDADVERPVSFKSPWSLQGIERDSDEKANAMHETVVAEIAAKLESGTFVVGALAAEGGGS